MLGISYKSARRTYGIAFRVAFALSTLSFLFASAYTQFRLSGIDKAAQTIEKIASPCIEYLLKIRESLNDVGKASAAFVDQVRRSPPGKPELLLESIDNLTQHSKAYLDLTLLPLEEEEWRAIEEGVKSVIRAVKSLAEIAQAGDADIVTQYYLQVVQPAILGLNETIPSAIAHDASVAQKLAQQITVLHKESLAVVVLLDVLSLMLSIFAAVIIYRMFRRHARLEDEHSQLQQSRVEELNNFAGRVAHDIKNPLGTISMGIELLQFSESPKEERETIELTQRALRRATQLVDGLLSFARAESNSEGGDHTNVQEVITQLGAEYSRIARQDRIDFSVESSVSAEVGCSPGIMVSMMENLIRNAIKHMGNSDKRQIIARARVEGRKVHVEIEDTGPGIPDEIKDHLFEPFVRGRPGESEGLGLGLATVKRLAEANGGEVGARSTRGSGSTFWFDLPLVSSRQGSNPHL